ncbi:MAG: hypothetical protein FD123_537 [Bacteroidetes bacterium]|nr:MAG: hypothetical protein FD123_537 [Bacteroidota bacterium]
MIKRYSQIISLLILALFCRQISAQQADSFNTSYPHNSIYAEAAGNGLLCSFNYERIILNFDEGSHLGIRAGLGRGFFDDLKSYPMELVMLYGPRRHLFEFGAGVTFLSGNHYSTAHGSVFSSDYFAQMYIFRLGYRFQHTPRGIQIRPSILGFMTRNFKNSFKDGFYASAGLSIGCGF